MPSGAAPAGVPRGSGLMMAGLGEDLAVYREADGVGAGLEAGCGASAARRHRRRPLHERDGRVEAWSRCRRRAQSRRSGRVRRTTSSEAATASYVEGEAVHAGLSGKVVRRTAAR